MTNREEFLAIYSDMLENVIYAKMGATDGNALIKKIQRSASMMRLSDPTRYEEGVKQDDR